MDAIYVVRILIPDRDRPEKLHLGMEKMFDSKEEAIEWRGKMKGISPTRWQFKSFIRGEEL